MTASRRAAAAAVLLLPLLLVPPACSRPTPEPTPAAQEQPAAADAATDAQTAEEEELSEALRHLNVLVYFPAVGGRGLVGEPHEIFMTPSPGDRAKQILADLISGPTGEDAARALPAGTLLRQVYVLQNGTAYVDFSADLKQGMGGGSAEELYAVYAVVNSVALNIPEIRRVGILIDGAPLDTLNGHLDLRRPLPPDSSIVLGRG